MGGSCLRIVLVVLLFAHCHCNECSTELNDGIREKECSDANEELKYTSSSDKTCDGHGEFLKKPMQICRCKKGYVRHDGKCITLNKCPKCFKENEEYMYTDMNDHTCEQIGNALEKPEYGCRCKDTFVRYQGECIAYSKCPASCSATHEELILSKREENTCDGPGADLIEPIEACRCQKGYVRDEGKCIKLNDCQKCFKDNEAYIYTDMEDHTCNDLGKLLEKPTYGCRCKDNYVRNDKGECIKDTDCPPRCTLPHEEFIMTKHEENTCDGPGGLLDEPRLACKCKRKYVRHEKMCIKKERCPLKCTKANEEYILAEFEDNTCEGKGKKLDESTMACRCKGDFVRTVKGYCIHLSKCHLAPMCSKDHEVYVLSHREEDTCDSLGETLENSVTECRCRSKYVRDSDGNCIPASKCPIKCPKDHEEWTSTKYSDETCDSPSEVLSDEVKACRCEHGYVRSDEKDCIERSECPPKCPNQNEEYILTTSEDSTCEGVGSTLAEPINACRCIEEYVRNDEGECMPAADCPPKCPGENEVYRFSRKEDNTCDGGGAPLEERVKMCRCKKNFLRNSSGDCVRFWQCPPKCTKLHEIYMRTHHEDSTCHQSGAELTHSVEACRCKDGYVRDLLGYCIDRKLCARKCTRPNEGFFNTKHAEKTCFGGGEVLEKHVQECRCRTGFVRYEKQCINPMECPICDENEEFTLCDSEEPTCASGGNKALKSPGEGCRCVSGFVRHEGLCIRQEECPSCGPNAAFVAALVEDDTCTSKGAALLEETLACRCSSGYVRHKGECIAQASCPSCAKNERLTFTSLLDPTCTSDAAFLSAPEEACRCNEGFVRYNGTCTLPCNCPSCNDPNEFLTFTDFEDDSCLGPGKALSVAKEMCICDEGFVRYNGTCIEEEFCPRCYGKNESLVMAEWYDSTCAVLGAEMPDHLLECRCDAGCVRHFGVCIDKNDCPPCEANEEYVLGHVEDRTCSGTGDVLDPPIEGCFCKPGFARHNETCILLGDCPTCPLNEVYKVTDETDETCCGPGEPLCRPSAGCRCQRGLVRLNGVCVSPSLCPKCGENEAYAFREASDATCATNETAFASRIEGCYCLPYFVRHNGKCIHTEECPHCDKDNEYLVHTIYEDATCTRSGILASGPGEVCRCLPGYVRRDGDCISKDECPKCPDDNEEFVWTESEDATCSKPPVALGEAGEACRCKAGFVRDEGACIAKGSCPSCPGLHEILIDTDEEDATCLGVGAPLDAVRKLCRCREGFVRHDGACILPSTCPTCLASEEYRMSDVGDSTCTSAGHWIDPPVAACYCQSKYVRHNGVCIGAEKCPSCSGSHVSLVRTDHEDSTCAVVGANLTVPVDACRCDEGFVRYGGICIHNSECPDCGENAKYVIATHSDPTCLTPAYLMAPQEACRCEKGFFRHNGRCVKKCPTCRVNEELIQTDKLDNTCQGPGGDLPSPKVVCRCKSDFVRHNGKCVPKTECP